MFVSDLLEEGNSLVILNRTNREDRLWRRDDGPSISTQ